MAAAGSSGAANTSKEDEDLPFKQLELSELTLSKMKPAKIIKDAVSQDYLESPGGIKHAPRQITGITISDRGDHFVTASDDESFRLYNVREGVKSKTFYSKKYGVDLPRFTHKSSAIIHASTKTDNQLRYHSLHDNRYLRYYKGHTERVTALDMSPVNDFFLSASVDRTVRLWDLRTPNCQGLLHLPSSSLVAFDPQGLVFAVAVNTFCRIMLYDMNNFDKDPFLTITLDDPTLKLISFPPRQIYMTSIEFSADTKLLLVGTSGNAHYILDSFEGHLLAKLEGHVGLERMSLNGNVGLNPVKGISGEEVHFTPDAKFVASGSVDGKICFWNIQHLRHHGFEGKPVDLNRHPEIIQPFTVLDGHPGPSRCVRFNPKYFMMVSGGNELALWLTDTSSDGTDEVREHFKKRMGMM